MAASRIVVDICHYNDVQALEASEFDQLTGHSADRRDSRSSSNHGSTPHG